MCIPDTFSMRLENIDPIRAQEWLLKNEGNRSVSIHHVTDLVRQMVQGRWKPNGEAIKFDSNGRLIDGQHRLMAVVNSGISIESWVAYNVPLEAYHTLDQGLKRPPSHLFITQGISNAPYICAVTRLIWKFKRHGLVDMWRCSQSPSPDELAEVFASTPGIADLAVHYKINRLMSPSLAGFLKYLFTQKDPKLAEHYFEKLAKGVGLEQGDPIQALRERLIANGTSNDRKMSRMEVCALCIVCWNALRDGRQVKRLTWRHNYEAFPIVA